VIPFRLSNPSDTIMRLVNEALRPFTGKLVVVHDILVYSLDEISHVEHLCQVFPVL